MREEADDRQDRGEQDLRQIPIWAQRYARNRTLSAAVNLVLLLALTGGMGSLLYLAVSASRRGQGALTAGAIVALVGVLALLVWSVARGQDAGRSIAERLYRREGEALPSSSPDSAVVRLSPWPAMLTGICVAGLLQVTGVASALGHIPTRYMQPLLALVLVPYPIYLGIKLRGEVCLSYFLFGVLYGIHTILIVAGVPIYFGKEHDALNVLIPVVGCALIAALAGHIYSRIALRRLRALARIPEGAEEIRGE